MPLPETPLADPLPEPLPDSLPDSLSDPLSGSLSDPLPDSLPDPVEAAAWFVVSQPGWVERVARRHTCGDRGLCAGCGTERPAPWPCVLVYIARRAVQIDQAQGLAWRAPRVPGPASAAARETPAAYSASSVA